MDTAFPNGGADARVTVERYRVLIDERVLEPDDRVELLDGVVVSMAPQDPRHAGVTHRVAKVLRCAIGTRADVREDKPVVLSPFSMPEPDVAVVAADPSDYVTAHPRTAMLIVEVAHSSLPQDRITKARIYASAGIPEYWIVNLRNDRIEEHRSPDVGARSYAEVVNVGAGERLRLVALPDIEIAAADLLPPPGTA